MNVALYCLCGASLVMTNVPEKSARILMWQWWLLHESIGIGHRPTDARTCARNRRRNDERAATAAW